MKRSRRSARAERIVQNGRSAFSTPEKAFFAALNDVHTYGGVRDHQLSWDGRCGIDEQDVAGHRPDLEATTEIAICDNMKFLMERTDLTSGEAYSVISMAADLRIAELVDGNVGVHVMVSKELIER